MKLQALLINELEEAYKWIDETISKVLAVKINKETRSNIGNLFELRGAQDE